MVLYHRRIFKLLPRLRCSDSFATADYHIEKALIIINAVSRAGIWGEQDK
jgi:hypothetical protein